MLQIPQQLQAVPAKSTATQSQAAAGKDPVKTESQPDEFARILQSQDAPVEGGGTAIPPKLAEEAMQQLREGVPLQEVLEHLREQLVELAATLETPFTITVSSEEIAETLELSDQALLARLGIRPQGTEGRERANVLPAQLLEENIEADADPDGPLQRPLKELLVDKEPGLNKERFEQLGRLQLAERGPQDKGAPNLGQAASLKALDMSPVFKDVIAGTPAQAKVLGEALSLPQRVGEQGWGQGLAQRVMWMVGNNQQSAELKLNPAHMGPLEIKVTMKNDQASVALLANNVVVKEALEQALPRLRDMFSQQDIQLVQVDVGQRQDPRQAQADTHLHRQSGQGGDGHDAVDTDAPDDSTSDRVEVRVEQGLGLVDAYA